MLPAVPAAPAMRLHATLCLRCWDTACVQPPRCRKEQGACLPPQPALADRLCTCLRACLRRPLVHPAAPLPWPRPLPRAQCPCQSCSTTCACWWTWLKTTSSAWTHASGAPPLWPRGSPVAVTLPWPWPRAWPCCSWARLQRAPAHACVLARLHTVGACCMQHLPPHAAYSLPAGTPPSPPSTTPAQPFAAVLLVTSRRQEKDTAVILGKEQERLKEEAEAAAAAAQRMERVLDAVGRAQAQPLRWGAGLCCWPAVGRTGGRQRCQAGGRGARRGHADALGLHVLRTRLHMPGQLVMLLHPASVIACSLQEVEEVYRELRGAYREEYVSGLGARSRRLDGWRSREACCSAALAMAAMAACGGRHAAGQARAAAPWSDWPFAGPPTGCHR